jgi:sugar phosphate isomerase/epimerase
MASHKGQPAGFAEFRIQEAGNLRVTAKGILMSTHPNNYPRLHNAMWPGLVGKGSPGAEPSLSLDTMLDLTAKAEVDGVKFDGVDIFLYEPHIHIDISDEELKRVADKIRSRGLVVGSVVAPVWPPTGGGSAMGRVEDRMRFVEQVRKACRIGSRLREAGARPHGVVRIDSACSVEDWSKDPEANTRLIAKTFSEACEVAESFGERLAAEGEICWGGMHSWRAMVRLLETVNRPRTLGFQADMAHTLLYTLGYNSPQDALLPAGYDWQDDSPLQEALRKLTRELRPWTIDFHAAQNDATVKGSGTHDQTGHHCLATDPAGKLDIAHDAGHWLRNEQGGLTKAFRHICWDGCMFPNEVMLKQQTWNDILAVMIAVRDNHGWREVEVRRRAAVPAVVVTSSGSAPRDGARRASTSKPTPRSKPAKLAARPAPAKRAAARKSGGKAQAQPGKAVKKAAQAKAAKVTRAVRRAQVRRLAKKPARRPARRVR